MWSLVYYRIQIDMKQNFVHFCITNITHKNTFAPHVKQRMYFVECQLQELENCL